MSKKSKSRFTEGAVTVKLDKAAKTDLKLLRGTYPVGTPIESPHIFRLALSQAANTVRAAQREGTQS